MDPAPLLTAIVPAFNEERPILGDEDVAAFPTMWQILLRRVHRRFFWLDGARIEDAIGDVIARRLTRAGGGGEQACPGRVELSVPSLYSAVCRRLGNSVRADRRRLRREREYARRKMYWFEEGYFVLNGLSADISIGEIEGQRDELERLLAECPAREQAFVRLRLQGIEDLMAYAEVLGVTRRPREELQKTVDQAWNCIRMKLRRLWRKTMKKSRECDGARPR